MIDVSVGSCHLSESDFVRQFERIEKIANNLNRKPEESTGILTSADRTDWAKAREILMQGDKFFLLFYACAAQT